MDNIWRLLAPSAAVTQKRNWKYKKIVIDEWELFWCAQFFLLILQESPAVRGNRINWKINKMKCRRRTTKKHTPTFLREKHHQQRQWQLNPRKNIPNKIKNICTLIKSSSTHLLGSGSLILLNTRCYTPKAKSLKFLLSLPQSTTDGSIVPVRLGEGGLIEKKHVHV